VSAILPTSRGEEVLEDILDVTDGMTGATETEPGRAREIHESFPVKGSDVILGLAPPAQQGHHAITVDTVKLHS
jgi:hypothetical protein